MKHQADKVKASASSMARDTAGRGGPQGRAKGMRNNARAGAADDEIREYLRQVVTK